MGNDDADVGVPIVLGQHTVRFYPLSWAAMKRLREQRAVVYSRSVGVMTPEWEDAVFDILFESAIAKDGLQTVTEKGTVLTRELFGEMLNARNIHKCFHAMTVASTTGIKSSEGEGVAEDGGPRPTKNPNGVGSTPM